MVYPFFKYYMMICDFLSFPDWGIIRVPDEVGFINYRLPRNTDCVIPFDSLLVPILYFIDFGLYNSLYQVSHFKIPSQIFPKMRETEKNVQYKKFEGGYSTVTLTLTLRLTFGVILR